MSEQTGLVKSDFLEMMPLTQAQSNYDSFRTFVRNILVKDLDYGVIPGVSKPSLFKPGAEKLRFVYGIGIEMEAIESTVNLQEKFVDYTYRATARSPKGQILAQCEGNCNSMEAKYAYIWKREEELPPNVDKTALVTRQGSARFEFAFAVNKAETTGKYGKPAAYWEEWKRAIQEGRARQVKKTTKTGKEMDGWELGESTVEYRVPNPDVIGLKNTIMKMAQKRAFVGTMLIATGASEYFTQDVEDLDLTGKGDIASEKPEMKGSAVEDIGYEDVPPDPKAEKIDGKWLARLEKCQTPTDVDQMIEKYKDEINAIPALIKMVKARRVALKAKTGLDF